MGRHTARRAARPRRFVMTRPSYFAVSYRINPWMDPGVGVDAATAVAQWQQLADLYRRLGHRVEFVEPVPGLPDMVYTANAGLILGRTAIVARFRHHQRDPEADAYAAWMAANGYRVLRTRFVNEGQGDLLMVSGMILAGYGFRTDPRAHTEIGDITGLPVISLQLTDPRFYHLDTALAVLDDTTIAYYPPAFTAGARDTLQELFPDAIIAGPADAQVLGLNVVSDGLHVIHPLAATGFADQLGAAGFVPIGVGFSELLKGGGSVKCCTLEAYSWPAHPAHPAHPA